jgi:uncharacterized membrane protein YidH (DUF202 family)
MKILGIVLIVLGILMFVFGNVTFSRKEKVVDAGPVEINKKEKHTIAWPNYAGGIIVVAGVVILLAGSKRRM